MAKLDIVLLSAKQGGGKSSLAAELVRIASRMNYTFAGSLKFADPLYEMHDYILNKIASEAKMQYKSETATVGPIFGKEVGEMHDYLRKEMPYKIQEYLINKMETFGMPRILPQQHFVDYLAFYVAQKIHQGKLFDTTKDGPLLQWVGTEFGRNNYGINVWVDILKNKIKKYEAPHWSELNRLVIVDDCRFENEFDAFPEALRVRLVCPEEVRKARTESWRDNTNHPSEIGLDAYEAEKKFDMYLQTDTIDVVHCSTLVAAQLQKGSWKEKREMGM